MHTGPAEDSAAGIAIAVTWSLDCGCDANEASNFIRPKQSFRLGLAPTRIPRRIISALQLSLFPTRNPTTSVLFVYVSFQQNGRHPACRCAEPSRSVETPRPHGLLLSSRRVLHVYSEYRGRAISPVRGSSGLPWEASMMIYSLP